MNIRQEKIGRVSRNLARVVSVVLTSCIAICVFSGTAMARDVNYQGKGDFSIC